MKYLVANMSTGQIEKDALVLQDGGLCRLNRNDQIYTVINTENYIVLRSTGLKDKNGVECFLGDWIKFETKRRVFIYKAGLFERNGEVGILVPRKDMGDLFVKIQKIQKRHGFEIVGNSYIKERV